MWLYVFLVYFNFFVYCFIYRFNVFSLSDEEGTNCLSVSLSVCLSVCLCLYIVDV